MYITYAKLKLLLTFRSSDDEDLNASPTNDNVLFKEKKDYANIGFPYSEHSPIETTTEL